MMLLVCSRRRCIQRLFVIFRSYCLVLSLVLNCILLRVPNESIRHLVGKRGQKGGFGRLLDPSDTIYFSSCSICL